MNGIYQVIVRGRILESRDLRKLLARAVAEKRSMDQCLKLFGPMPGSAFCQTGNIPGIICDGTAGRH